MTAFRIVSRDGDMDSRATGDVAMTELERLEHAAACWSIEEYHRALKPCGGVERAQVRAGRAIRAFLRLSHHFFATRVSGEEATARIVRGAVRAYLARPLYGLPSTA